MKNKILIIDDELPIREVLSATLRDEGYEVMTAADADSGFVALEKFRPQIVFLDIWMPGSLDGIEVLTSARKKFSNLEFVMISGHGTIETAVKATKLGAWDFIEKPLSMDKILITITNILNLQQEKSEKENLLTKFRKNIAFIGESKPLRNLKESLAQYAASNNALFLLGASGVGKELAALNIHYMSHRAGRSFVEVTTNQVPESLLEVELFGAQKGYFPHLKEDQRGKVEMAEGGTLFINDVAELSVKIQQRLQKLMQEMKFHRAGSAQLLDADVRLVCASSKNLEESPLFTALQTDTLRIPSLREHADDIPGLVLHFSDMTAKLGGFEKKEFSQRAVERMKIHSWPGNVLELKNFIERVYILTPSEFVDLHDLKFAGLSDENQASGDEKLELPSFREARAQFEKEYLVKKISENAGNISRTAEVIGLERSYLHRKMKVFGIESGRNDEHTNKDSK